MMYLISSMMLLIPSCTSLHAWHAWMAPICGATLVAVMMVVTTMHPSLIIPGWDDTQAGSQLSGQCLA